MMVSRVQVAPGSWHSPTDGPQAAGAIGAHINSLNAASLRSKYGQRFDHVQARQRIPAPMPAKPFMPPVAPVAQAPLQQVATSITPSLLYSQSQIQRMANREFGRAIEQADPRTAQKALMGRGLSLDAGTLASVMPQVAHGLSNALMARNVQPLQDQLANQQFLLQGQQQQGQEFLGLSDLLRQLQGNQFARQQQTINPLLAMLGGF